MANSKAKPMVLITLFVIIILVIAGYYIFRPKNILPPAVAINTKNQPTIGQANAPIHFVAFEDLKCVNCKIFNNTIYPQLKQKYIDTGKAKYTLINLAFISGSMPAGNAAHCLYAQNKDFFFPFIEYVYHHQPAENVDWASVPKLLQMAKAATPKANLEQLSQCIVEGKYNQVLQNNLKLAAKIMNNNVATPALYVNGRKAENLSMENIEALVKEVQGS